MKFEQNCRSIVISGKGKIFTSGLDLTQLSSVIMGGPSDDGEELSEDVGRRGFRVKKILEEFQVIRIQFKIFLTTINFKEILFCYRNL